LNPLSYENVGIKFGGGSVIYGSGAIGGSIHLNNSLDYNKGFEGTVFSEYGSFATINSWFGGNLVMRISVNADINHSQSKNDFEITEKFINRNGEYQNTSFNLGLGYKINPNNELYWQSQYYDSDQHYPIFSKIKPKQNIRFRQSEVWQVGNYVPDNLKII
jgi:iron complex outermembrane receptor protein